MHIQVCTAPDAKSWPRAFPAKVAPCWRTLGQIPIVLPLLAEGPGYVILASNPSQPPLMILLKHRAMKDILTLCTATILLVQLATLQAAEPGSTHDQPVVRVEKDVSYLGPECAEKADLYLPPTFEAGKKYPGIVIIHGGGWTGGDKGAAREKNIGTTLASHGYVCMSINYALAKTGSPTFPQNIQDCKRAVPGCERTPSVSRLMPRTSGRSAARRAGILRPCWRSADRRQDWIQRRMLSTPAAFRPRCRCTPTAPPRGMVTYRLNPMRACPCSPSRRPRAGAVGLGLAYQAALEGRSAHADPARYRRQDHTARSVHAISRSGKEDRRAK